MIKRALEGAGFISAYDRSGIARDARRAGRPRRWTRRRRASSRSSRASASCSSGAIDRQGSRLRLSVKAAQAVTGKVIASAPGRAANKDRCSTAVTSSSSDVRKALGDDTSDSAQLFAMDALSATSLDVVRVVRARAWKRCRASKFEEALTERSAKAVELDPKFGIGYAGDGRWPRRTWGAMQDAEKYVKRSDQPRRRHDRARALSDARDVLFHHQRLPAVREGIRRSHYPVFR